MDCLTIRSSSPRFHSLPRPDPSSSFPNRRIAQPWPRGSSARRKRRPKPWRRTPCITCFCCPRRSPTSSAKVFSSGTAFSTTGRISDRFFCCRLTHSYVLLELMQSLELAAEWLRPRACRELTGVSPACVAGVHAPHEAGVDPRALTAALVSACEAAGVRIAIGAASELITEGDRVAGVRTSGGEELVAGSVVVAAGPGRPRTGCPAPARPPVAVEGQILTPRRDRGGAGLRADTWSPARLRRSRAATAGWSSAPPSRSRDSTPGDRGRRPRAASRGLPGPARGRRARAGRDGRGPTAGDPDNMPLVGPARSTGCCSRPAASAAGSCSRRSPPSALPRYWPAAPVEATTR